MTRAREQGLHDQVLLITGAASGMGEACAYEAAAQGARLVLVDCDAQPLARVAHACGPHVLQIVADVCDAAIMQAAVAEAVARWGRLDQVFANAGIASFGPLHLTDPEAWQRCVAVNVFGVFNTVRPAVPALAASGGHVMVNSSLSAFAHAPTMSAYAASKAAVEAMSDAWRLELAAHGISVGQVFAGWVNTPLMQEGALHPSFTRLRATMPAFLNRELSAPEAARRIVRAMVTRQRRVWLPAWVRVLFALRSLLHLPVAEAALRQAAPEIEAHYRDGLAEHGALANSVGPRECARSLQRQASPP